MTHMLRFFGYFYPRSPCGERPQVFQRIAKPFRISIHALLAESDAGRRCRCQKPGHFYPRSPCGERPVISKHDVEVSGFLSTLSLRRATFSSSYGSAPALISIHALLAESDITTACENRFFRISIHALLAESDDFTAIPFTTTTAFLSTLSLRRATQGAPVCILLPKSFLSTLSLRRATPDDWSGALLSSSFLSTLSLRRATFRLPASVSTNAGFLSTLSLRRATHSIRCAVHRQKISIHALLAESDTLTALGVRPVRDFYPRSPCGERLAPTFAAATASRFLSTLSLRRATTKI